MEEAVLQPALRHATSSRLEVHYRCA